MATNNKITDIYAMLVGDVLIIADSYKDRRCPTKIICLEGLSMRELTDKHGYGI